MQSAPLNPVSHERPQDVQTCLEGGRDGQEGQNMLSSLMKPQVTDGGRMIQETQERKQQNK